MIKNKLVTSDCTEIPKYRVAFVSAITLLCLAGILLARLHIEQLTGNSLALFANTNGIYADWFLSCKETFYFVLALCICAYAVGERIFPDHICRINPLYRHSALFSIICTVGYLLLSGISCLFSENREVVLRGVCTEYEGLSAIFSYCVLFLFGFNFLSSERLLQIFQKLLLILGAISAVLAIFEYTVVPLAELPMIQHLMAPPKYYSVAESLQHANTFREAVLMFHNSNYAGAYFILLFPIPFSMIISEKALAKRLSYGVLCVALLIAGVMTNATTSLYVMLAELLFLFLFLLFSKLIRIKRLLISIGLALVLLCGADLSTGHAFFNTLSKSLVNAGTYTAETHYPLREVTIQSHALHIASDKTGYSLMPPFYEGETLQVFPDADTDYEIKEHSANHFTIYDEASDSAIIADVRQGVLHVDVGYQSTLDFAVTTDGLQLIAQNGAFLPEVPKAPMADSSLSKYNSLFTGRGYIWLNSMPILKECFLIGKGAGNFPFYFIQNDIVGLSNTNGTYHLVIDKTHSMYLQTAIASGVPALILMLLLFGDFLLRGMKCLSYMKNSIKSSSSVLILLCLYTGTAGYMISGLVNDSTIAVSPVFWMLFGTAYSVCIDLEKRKASDSHD